MIATIVLLAMAGFADRVESADVFGPDMTRPKEVSVVTKLRCTSDRAEMTYIVQSPVADRIVSASINGRSVKASDLAAVNQRIGNNQIDKISWQLCPSEKKGQGAIRLFVDFEVPEGKRFLDLALQRNGTLSQE